MRYAVLFPGQGSQFVGMGSDLFDRRPDLLGEPADEILGWSLRATCLEGPEEELVRTDRVQPALYALSFALWEELRNALGRPPVAGAGHSLGEYTALAAAGMVDFFTGLALVAARGRVMAAAAEREPSGMAALLGTDASATEDLAERRRAEGGRLWVANLNAPGQVVVAGSATDIDWIVEHARELGVRRAIPLDVQGAFHSPYMEPARAELRREVSAIRFSAPVFPVWSNVTARPISPEEVEDLLSGQLTAPVRFQEILVAMAAAGVEAFVHVGPGDVTAGMARRSAPEAEVVVVSTPDDIPEAAEGLAVE